MHLALELGQPLLGHLHPARSLEVERLAHDGHGQDAELLGNLRNHRRCAGAGAAAQTGGDEHHMRAAQAVGDALAHLVGRLTTHLGFGTRTEAGLAQLQQVGSARPLQRLPVGVGDDELDVLHVAPDHVLDGIAAGTAHANDLDHRSAGFRFEHFKGHTDLLGVNHRSETRNVNDEARSASIPPLTVHASHTRTACPRRIPPLHAAPTRHAPSRAAAIRCVRPPAGTGRDARSCRRSIPSSS